MVIVQLKDIQCQTYYHQNTSYMLPVIDLHQIVGASIIIRQYQYLCTSIVTYHAAQCHRGVHFSIDTYRTYPI